MSELGQSSSYLLIIPSRKMIYYIGAMMLFHTQATRHLSEISNHMRGIPTQVIDGLVARFTESPRIGTERKSTSKGQTLCLTYMFALMLRVDEYAVDTGVVASDLGMDVAK